MKNIIALLIIASTCAAAFGQPKDTAFISIGQDTGRYEKQRFIDRYDYVFGTQQPTRFLLKWNVLAALLPVNKDDDGYVFTAYDAANSDISRVELSAELKIAKWLSFNTTGSIGFLEGDFIKGKQKRTEWRVEPRFYYEMPARIKAGKSADNLSGNYIGFEYGRLEQTRKEGADPGNWFTSNTYSLRFGLQRRLFRYGYADISAGLGYRQDVYSSQGPAYRSNPVFFNTRVAIGLALAAPRAGKGSGSQSYCDVLRCFLEERQMFRFDLLQLVQFRSDYVQFKPSFAYERKIGESPFSVELEGTFTGTGRKLYFTGDERTWGWEYKAALSAEPRWYFLQKNRIAKGKSGNNLAGVYGGVNARYKWHYSEIYNQNWEKGAQLSPIVGFQYRLFRNGFVNYKFGVAWDEVQFDRFEFSDPSHWFSEMKIGLAF